jgi:trehalose 6-phosphate synthase/phosphatase
VHIVSGRKREQLERWLGDLPIGMHAEHGYWSRMAREDEWVAMDGQGLGWMQGVRRILDEVTARTPGSLVEAKTASLAWHWRMAEPELGAARAEALWATLERHVGSDPVDLLRGEKVLEVRLRGVDKGRVVARVLAATGDPTPTVAAIGDDATDEEMFRALPPEAVTVSVGFVPSTARFRVARPREARALLAALLVGRT